MDIQKTQVNSVQQFSTLSAFKSNKNIAKPENDAEPKNTSEGIDTTSAKNILNQIDVNDIRECAKTVGEYNITDDDIKYGLMYGRSVIAEWLC